MDKELSIKSIFNLLFKKIKYIIAITFVLGICLAGIRSVLVAPVYKSTVDLVLSPKVTDGQQLNLNQLQTNKKLIKTYENIIFSDNILNQVNSKVDTDYTNDDLRSKIKLVTVAESQTFGISVEDNSPEMAANLANTVADVFQENIDGYYSANINIKVISTAKPSDEKTSPIFIKDFIFGSLLGLVISIFSILFFEYFRKTITSKQALENFNWKDLGSINLNDTYDSDLKQKIGHKKTIETLENIEAIQSKLRVQMDNSKVKTFMISSTNDNLEQQLFTYLIAKSFAESGKKTLIVDANPHNITLNNFNIQERKIKNLSIISITTQSNIFSSIFNSNTLEDSIAELNSNFDIVIFNGSPLIGSPEGQILATKIKNVVITFKKEFTKFEEIYEINKFFNDFNITVLGYVFEEEDKK